MITKPRPSRSTTGTGIAKRKSSRKAKRITSGGGPQPARRTR